jgi:hypothetical protein
MGESDLPRSDAEKTLGLDEVDRPSSVAADRATLTIVGTPPGLTRHPEPNRPDAPFPAGIVVAGPANESAGTGGSRSTVANGVIEANVLDEPNTLRLVRWGLRFESGATEAAFGLHHQRVAVPLTRLGMATALVVWAAYTGVARFAVPESFNRVAATVLLVIVPLITFCLAITYRSAWLKWMLPVVAVTNATAGVVVVVLCLWVRRLDVAMAGTIIATYFGFTIFRMRTGQAAASTAAYGILFHLALFEELAAGRVGLGIALPYSVSVLMAFVTGLLVCALLDRSMRQAYQQERTIEAQRLAIDRERTRAAALQAEATARELALLNAEVRRQVAERSRDLAEALSRLSESPHLPSALVPGNVVEGRYRVVKLLGTGGMGQVHEVERLVDGRRLALKMLNGAPKREALMRLAREAEVAAQLDHPNVVPALDVGITGSGAVFIVMQLVLGPTLAQQAVCYGDAAWAIPILRQIAEALGAMHGHGIIHRDLKPSNVLLDGRTAKVTDFGIASLSRTSGNEPLTRTGVIIGTPLYMAPELADGAREASAASDVFSLGVLAYEILANRLPYLVPPAFERLHGREPEKAPSLVAVNPTLPAELARLVDDCLTFAPLERPTAQDVGEALGQLSAS